jgi:hypothetical protein
MHHWMVNNYVESACIGIRRMTDPDSRSISLWRLLWELLRYPGAVTRRSQQSLYAAGGREVADLTFYNIAGPGKSFLPRSVIVRDIRAIEDVEERIRRFVNKRIAHIGPHGAIRRPPTFNEMHSSLDTLERVLLKYHTLLTAEGLT